MMQLITSTSVKKPDCSPFNQLEEGYKGNIIKCASHLALSGTYN